MKNKFIDVCGKKFGSLLVIARESNTPTGMVRWKCKCDCGNETIAIGRDLRIGKHKSCGCKKGECIRQSRRKNPFEWLYYKLKFVAKKSNRPFNLTFEEYLDFTKIPNCYYCNLPIIWKPHYDGSYGGYNLDRRDNSQGYTKDNCVVCCHLCNHTKSNLFSEREMLKIGKIIWELRK